MLDALQLGMIPLGILNRPMTFRFLLSTPHGFTYQDLTLDIPGFPFELAPLSRLAGPLWRATYGSAVCSAIVCELCTVVNWKADGPLLLTVPAAASGAVHGSSPAPWKNSGVAVLHTGHSDTLARRRIYMAGMPTNWQIDGTLSAIGTTQLYYQWAQIFMAFKGTALPNPYRWLIAYPRIVEAGDTNFFGVAFRQPEFVRICSHCGEPPEGSGLDWP